MDFNVLECRRFTQPQSKKYEKVTRLVKDFEIDLELSNGREYTIDGKSYHLKKGDMCVRFPGQELSAKGWQDSYILTLSFDMAYFPQPYSRNTIGATQKPIDCPFVTPLSSVISFEDSDRLLQLYKTLVTINDLNDKKAKLIVKEIIFLANAQQNRNEYTKLEQKPSAVDMAIAFIKQNLSKDVTLDQLSALTFLDKSYLIKIFKKQFGKTPYQMLIDLRLEKARDIILATDTSVYKTAEHCGYKTTSFFIAEYKKKYGLTPEQDRIKNKTINV